MFQVLFQSYLLYLSIVSYIKFYKKSNSKPKNVNIYKILQDLWKCMNIMVFLIWEKYSLLRILEESCAKKNLIHFLLFVLLTLNLLSENSKWGHLGVENSQGDRLHV